MLKYPNSINREKRSTGNRKKRSVKGRFKDSKFTKIQIRSIQITNILKIICFEFCLNLLAPCKTLHVEPISNEKCIFPFKYDGKYYDGCAWSCSNGGYYWCPTQVDEDNNYIANHWGKCSSECDVSTENTGRK